MEPLLVQLQFQFNQFREQILARDKEFSQKLNETIKAQALTSQISQIEMQKQFLATVYQGASSYTNIVILAGYAGLFAIWQITKDKFSDLTTFGIAALIVLSLLLFVFWEVFKMIQHALFATKLNRIIAKNIDPENSSEAWQLAWTDYAQQEARLWPFFLIPTVLTGFGAGVWMLSVFTKSLASLLLK